MSTYFELMRRYTNSLNIVRIATMTALLLPGVTFAGLGEIDSFVNNIVAFINAVLIPFVFAVALGFFIWGMFLFFIAGGGDESKREKGKALMLWAIIAFVVMATIVGIVNLLAGGLVDGMNGVNTDSFEITPGS